MKFNASLASIHAQGGLTFVNNMLSDSSVGKAYIGGLRKGIYIGPSSDDGSSKLWKWVDNSTWDFTNWAVGEPEWQYLNDTYESVTLVSDFKMIAIQHDRKETRDD